MAQHDYVIDNQSAPSFRSDLNNALSAIVTNNGGSGEPSTTYAGMWWHDTGNNLLKIRNEANDAWITVAVLNQTSNTSAPTDGSITFAKLNSAAVVTSSETIASNNNNTTIPTSAAVKAYTDSVTSGASAGAIGTYIFAWAGSSDISRGSTVAGSSLASCSAAARNLQETNTAGTTFSNSETGLSGTWRCMGTYDYQFNRTTGPTAAGATLWLRIS